VKKDLFIKYINSLIRDYNTQFRLALKGAREEPVHELRVRIKHLNALFVFLDEARIYRKSSRTFFHLLKDFFKSAGYLRDIQVLKSLVGNYRNQVTEDITEYETYLINKEITAGVGFYKKSSEYPRKEQTQIKNEIIKSVRESTDDKLSRKSLAFITKRLNRIEKYLLPADTAKYLHKIRQTLKQLRFFLEIYHSSSEVSLIEEADYNEIKEIENIIGGWNDRTMLIEDIKRYRNFKQKLDSGTSDHALKLIVKLVRKEMKEMVSDVKPRLLKFIYHLKYSML
jgi:CHAD domain-containing protein